MSLRDEERILPCIIGLPNPDKEARKYYMKKDVREAMINILRKLRELPNRDESIEARMHYLDGGGIGRFDTIKIIEEELGFEEQEAQR